MKEAEEARRTAAQQQLTDVKAVCVDGMRDAKLNGVYSLSGNHAGYPCFESSAGKHLCRAVDEQEWRLADDLDDIDRDPAMFACDDSTSID